MLPSIESGLFGSQCVSEDVRGRIEHTLEAGIATVQGTRIGLELGAPLLPFLFGSLGLLLLLVEYMYLTKPARLSSVAHCCVRQ